MRRSSGFLQHLLYFLVFLGKHLESAVCNEKEQEFETNGDNIYLLYLKHGLSCS